MTNEELNNILTGKKRGNKTTKRFGGDLGLVKSNFEIGSTTLAVTSDEDGDRDWVKVSSNQHFTYNESAETEVEIAKLPHRSYAHAVIKFSVVERKQDDEVRVARTSTTFVSVDQLVALRDQITKEIRKAKRKDWI